MIDADVIECERRLALLRKHGCRSTSYFTLQHGIDAFFFGEKGYVGFERLSEGLFTCFGLFPETFVLSDPVCHPTDAEEVLGSFLAETGQAFFLQISENTARVFD